MGMYCCCGIKKREDWKCECDWKGWFLCFEHDLSRDHFPKDIPIKPYPDIDGTYEVRTYSSGDYDEVTSEFSVIKKNWGEVTNLSVSHWKIAYSDGWLGHIGVYAWKQK